MMMKVALARLLRAAHALNHIAFKIERHFGDQDRCCAAGDTGVERDIPRFSAHDLHDRAAVMRFGRITQAVNHFHDRVHGCIITDRIVAAGDIVIDGAGDADTGYAAQRKVACAAERTVAADDDDPLHIDLFADVDGFLHTFFGFEFGAARGIQDRAAAVDDIGDTSQIHFVHIAVHQPVVAAANAHHAETVFTAGAHHCADRSIHARRVAAACQNTDRFHLSSPHDIFMEMGKAHANKLNFLRRKRKE